MLLDSDGNEVGRYTGYSSSDSDGNMWFLVQTPDGYFEWLDLVEDGIGIEEQDSYEQNGRF